jgi:hypothetical protein
LDDPATEHLGVIYSLQLDFVKKKPRISHKTSRLAAPCEKFTFSQNLPNAGLLGCAAATTLA